MPDVAEFDRMPRRGDDAGSAGSEGRKNAYSDGKESRGLRWFLLRPFRRLRLLVHHLHRDGALESISGD